MNKKKQKKQKRLSPAYADVIDLPKEEKEKIYKRESKKANNRLLQLERAGAKNYIYKQASVYNIDELDRKSNRFYVGTKFQDEDDLDYALQQVLTFNRSKTSTLTGHFKDIERKRALLERDASLISDETLNSFTQFLYSQQFKTLKGMVDSNQILEDFNQAIDDGFTVKQIMKQYEKFLTSDMTFEQIAERRKKGRGLR